MAGGPNREWPKPQGGRISSATRARRRRPLCPTAGSAQFRGGRPPKGSDDADLCSRSRPIRCHALSPLRRLGSASSRDQPRPLAQLRPRHAAPDQTRDLPRGVRPRDHAFRSGQQLRPAAGQRRTCLRFDPGRGFRRRQRRIARRTRHLVQGGLSDVGRPLRRMGQPQIPDRVVRPVAAADGSRLCRHLLFAPLRSRHPARGDDGRARPYRPVGARALCRDLQLQFGKDAGGGGDPEGSGHALRDPPAELQHAQPLGRAGRPEGDAGRAGDRLDRVHAAGAGDADEEVSRRYPGRQPRRAGQEPGPRHAVRTRHRQHPQARRNRAGTRPDAGADGDRLGACAAMASPRR